MCFSKAILPDPAVSGPFYPQIISLCGPAMDTFYVQFHLHLGVCGWGGVEAPLGRMTAYNDESCA